MTLWMANPLLGWSIFLSHLCPNGVCVRDFHIVDKMIACGNLILSIISYYRYNIILSHSSSCGLGYPLVTAKTSKAWEEKLESIP